jgi:hypothetical protein
MWKAFAALTNNAGFRHKSLFSNGLCVVCPPPFHTFSTMGPAGSPGAVPDTSRMGAAAPINGHDGNEL